MGQNRQISRILILVTFVLFTVSVQTIATPVQWSGNGHWYDVLTGADSWVDALSDAQGASYNSMTGYLATVTSSEENQFILDNFTAASETLAFIGGRDDNYTNPSQNPPVENANWRWVSGPEAGEIFYREDGDQSILYTNWASGQPDRPDVHYLSMSLNSGTWYDTNNGGYSGVPSSVSGRYIIEYSFPVPEPATMILLGAGLAGLAGFKRKFLKA